MKMRESALTPTPNNELDGNKSEARNCTSLTVHYCPFQGHICAVVPTVSICFYAVSFVFAGYPLEKWPVFYHFEDFEVPIIIFSAELCLAQYVNNFRQTI